MASIPGEIIEAALVDGANPLGIFLSVVVPVSCNGIITAALFSFLFAWSDFVFALTLTSVNTVTPVTSASTSSPDPTSSNGRRHRAAAVLASIPAAALLVLAQRYIASGITGGAVK
jgi:multiple sugar transport system permease protein